MILNFSAEKKKNIFRNRKLLLWNNRTGTEGPKFSPMEHVLIIKIGAAAAA